MTFDRRNCLLSDQDKVCLAAARRILLLYPMRTRLTPGDTRNGLGNQNCIRSIHPGKEDTNRTFGAYPSLTPDFPKKQMWGTIGEQLRDLEALRNRLPFLRMGLGELLHQLYASSDSSAM